MINQALVKIFREIAVLLEMKEVPFKPQAYEKVSYIIGSLQEEVSDIYKEGGIKALEDIPGVGKGIAEKIEEYIKTGHIKDYEKLKKEMPVDIEGLRSVEGIGPKTILHLYKKLGIKNLDQLEKSAKAGKIRNIEGMGEKTEEKILKGIGFLKSSGGRLVSGFIMPTAKMFLDRIRALPEVGVAEFAGSLRRRQETIGDLDFIVFSKKPEAVIENFLKFPEVKHVYSKGKHKALVRLDINIDADISVVSPESYGSAMIAWTGNKQHNIDIRKIAEKHGWLLNDFGLWKDKVSLASKTEEEVYNKMGMDWIPPEMRNDSGEIKAALEHKIPELIGYDDLKGDLQVQTDWTDGEHSIEEMAKAAEKLGLEYICITDHTKSLAMTGGSDEKKLLKQMAEIDNVNSKFKIQSSKFKILKGAEVNIMKDGSLDIDDETLAMLDVVGAAVHHNFNMSEDDMTKRITRAMKNPNVDIIFHPTGRIINKREAYKVNVEELLKIAKKTKTVMEIDAFPDRLDLKDEYIRKGVEMGVKFSIDSDAHHTSHLQYLEYGIAQARRGWAEAKDIINTRPWQEMLKLLK
ncbi:MAG: DNA polymerase III [Candidatus Yanofskybacteria bacterium RIFCSPHIGHO2_02_FULL_41_29]|uniref:DNA polymerase beta n=1 Tax=Candidatus Yanofskybacteria bacterium RIFCSPHIGHO2_01_FULL_41_53 TaxID=1802663 RepID=A0A1F8EKJ2_9BACT|nr:MAG: DNA polymerase III [Candidatus Yanofskybacteria bacterium RIFCSPHIGHO2_01_FULL_41_53]OGN10774.1 MAG: DNA polymerase III [Candidatus Yanofskybacteria bacterium RIFCSPHIGHO2_02_FULL_41_29]OGN17065.1 MAG: DNA polymerase III [Candidatus Yanofskybacteria bacterium RIFCSPHIGHO2_12_FULL_41_9]OGN21795.1 MAG: DNA polymerase III [Candidatus Yanofskybacteria bacterium RIFCSPLOWO2_01_FULL_41_67]OGN29409.1 MAG: DNA polymerase III [Candidatus Yanofskybacteria bacterium RIFCSPLOWO2_02_FULL_41_13]OGN3